MRFRQDGAALIAAIFVITALAGLGGVMTQRLMLSTEETINEWYSGQSLAAAESGIQWAIWDLANGANGGVTPTDLEVTSRSWMSTTVTTETVNGLNIYTISSVGKAGGTAANPRTQRNIFVQFMP